MAATDEEVVARILRAAEDVIERYGLQRFTMGDVAEAAGVRRQGLYDHVSGKDDLVRAILAVKARALHDRVQAALDAQDDFSGRLVEGLLFIIEDSLAEPYMSGLVGEGEFATVSTIVGADDLMPKLTGDIWRPVLEQAERDEELVPGHDFDDVERWLTYVTLMLVGARAQGLSDEESDRRMLAKLLLPALARA